MHTQCFYDNCIRSHSAELFNQSNLVMTLSPIALFVYKRLRHTRQTIESLLKNAEANESILYIFSDAPKSEKDEYAVQEVRSYISSVKGFREIHIIQRQENFGLAKSIITGVTEILNSHETIIVVEDDPADVMLPVASAL